MNSLRRSLSLLALLPSLPILNRVFNTEVYAAETLASVSLRFAALVDTIVPADESPGAIDLGLDKQILEQISRNSVFFGRVESTLSALDGQSINQFHQLFLNLNLEQRTAIVNQLLQTRGRSTEDQIILSSLREKVITAFYRHQTAFDMLAYHPPSQGGYPDYARPPL